MEFCVTNPQTDMNVGKSNNKTAMVIIVIFLVVVALIAIIGMVFALLSYFKTEKKSEMLPGPQGSAGEPGPAGPAGPPGKFQNIGIASISAVSMGDGQVFVPVDNKIIVSPAMESILLFETISTNNSESFVASIDGLYVFNITVDIKKDNDNAAILRAYKGKQHIGYYTLQNNGSFSTSIVSQLKAGETFTLTLIPKTDRNIHINSLGTFMSVIVS